MRHLSILVGSSALLAACADAPSGLSGQSILRLDRETVTLSVGDTIRLRPVLGRVRHAAVSWTADDNAIVLVEDGLIIPLAPGRTKIHARTQQVGGLATATATVTISTSDARPTALTIVPEPSTLAVGDSVQLAAMLTFSHGRSVLLRSSVAWSVIGSAVGVSRAGRLVAIASGSSRVVASALNLSDTVLSDTVAVTVAPLPAPPPPGNLPGTTRAHYVASTGTRTGTGAPDQPWDFATALAHPVSVKPGDTIYVRGGTYRGIFRSVLAGTADAPIIVRSYRGERAVLNANGATGDALTVAGPHSTFWGLEVTDSLRSPTARHGSGVTVIGSHTRLVNLVVHDMSGEGIGFWSGAEGGEVYGCLVFNNGYEDASRSHGHGIYTQNRIGTKYISDNVIFNQFGWGIHMYGSSAAALRSYVIEGNTVFDNGALASVRGHENLLVGGGAAAGDIKVVRNVLYRSPGVDALNALLGYSPGTVNDDLLFHDNVVLGGSMAMSLGNWHSVNVARNTFSGNAMMSVSVPVDGVGSYTWLDNTHLADPLRQIWRFGTAVYAWSDFVQASGLARTDNVRSTGSTPTVVVRPNRFEEGRATVTVVNPSGAASVAVNLAGVLRSGDRYVVRDARDLFGAPVASGTFGGGAVSVTLANRPQPRAIGGSPSAAPAMTPHFAVLVVTRE